MSNIPELFLNYSVRKLEQMTAAITLCLGKLTDEQIWRRDQANENTIGNLVLHLCGNLGQWIGTGIAGFPLDRCARVMLEEVRDHLMGTTSVQLVEFVLFDADAKAAFEQAFALMR